MNKIERDGKVAVLYSPGYGAGWSTWADARYSETLCMDARIVEPVLAGDIPAAVAAALALVPDLYTGGAESLEVNWVTKGDVFEIVEADGYEHVKILGNVPYMRA